MQNGGRIESLIAADSESEPSGTIRRRRALVSIHDVMPETLENVGQLIDLCAQNDVPCPTLLVVPGCDWSDAGIDQIRDWSQQGCELAGHGWIHRCEQIRGWKHRLHSLFISRNVAEHLCLSSDGVVELMRRCGQWFQQKGFDVPKLYVPPAWALGRASVKQLSQQPFAIIETISGLLDVRTGARQRLPLVGFEADTLLRQVAVGAFNRLTRFASPSTKRPIRIGIHPFDDQLRLREDLRRTLAMNFDAVSYQQFCE